MFGRDNQVASKGQIVLFRNDGDQVQIKEAGTLSADNNNLDDGNRVVLNVLLTGGIPLNDPVTRYGPSVMNVQDEIYQPILGYRSRRLGMVSPRSTARTLWFCSKHTTKIEGISIVGLIIACPWTRLHF